MEAFEIGRLARLELGYVGETESREICIDMTDWLKRWPGAAIAVDVLKPDREEYYLAPTEVEDGILRWVVTDSDVDQAGRGMAQIRMYDFETGKVYKSRTVETIIRASIDMEEDLSAPHPMDTWVARAVEAKENAIAAQEAAEDARDAATTAAAEAQDSAEAAEDAATRAVEAADAAQELAAAAEGNAKTAAAAATTATAAAEAAEGSADRAEAESAAAADKAAAAQESAQAATAAAESAAASAEETAEVAEVAKKSAPAIIVDAGGKLVQLTDGSERNAQELKSIITAVQEGSGTPSPDNVRPITGWDAVSLWRESDYDEAAEPMLTTDLPETIYGGRLDWTTGVLTVTHVHYQLAVADLNNGDTWIGWNGVPNLLAYMGQGVNRQLGIASAWGNISVNTNSGSPALAKILLNNSGMTQAEWKAAWPDLVMDIVIPINNTYDLQLTPQQLALLKGRNSLWSNTGSTELSYIADTRLYIDNAIAALAAGIINQ